MAMAASQRLLLVSIDREGCGGGDGGGDRQNLADDWLKHGRKRTKSPPGVATSPAVIAAMVRVRRGGGGGGGRWVAALSNGYVKTSLYASQL